MIRPFTLITMLLAALSGAYLFAVKHQAQVLDDEIASFGQSARLDAMRIRVLQGQWSLETDPTRLQQLAAQFTNLQPMQPAQLVTLAALRESLPPPGSAAPGSNPELPGQTAPQLPELAQQDASVPGGLPMPPPPAPPPELLASVAPAAPVPSRVVAHRVSRSALHLANTELAESLPPPRPFYPATPPREAPPRYYAPVTPREAQPVVQASAIGQAGPVGAQVMSVKATAMVQQYTPAAAVSSPDGGSVLGMASNLAPPQPMPQNGNDN
jgi:hypothetical protein